MFRKRTGRALLLLGLIMISMVGCSSGSGQKTVSPDKGVNGEEAASQNTASVSSETLSDGKAAVSVSENSEKDSLSANESTKDSEELVDEEVVVEDLDDGVVALDEEDIYEGATDEETALEIKDVKDDNAPLPFETDTPIFAFDTDYTLYKSDSGEVRSGAIDALKYIVDRGFKWCIISVDYENSKEGRLQGEILSAINNTDNYLGFYVVNSGAERYQWCIENGADILVDDNEKTASLADDAHFHTLLVDADDDIVPTLFLHPMGNGTAYGGFQEYVDALFPNGAN
ncbi:hypothetical protein QYZ88_008315 [Lachnospiraceae bacterium C1.1]|nr:hypothetical protein [Lachnospiraceae bacterium C1.1]